MEHLTTKILSPHPNWKHVASLHSKRQLAVLALYFIELHEVKRAPRAVSQNGAKRHVSGYGGDIGF